MPIVFYLVSSIALVSFLMICYKGINRLIYVSKKHENKILRSDFLELERLKNLERIEAIVDKYETLIKEVDSLKQKEFENERLQQAMYKAFLSQYLEKSKSSMIGTYRRQDYGLERADTRYLGSIKTSIKEINPEYQNYN